MATDQPIVGIVLAAGMSRRLGQPKQLLELDGKPLVAHVVERCLASRLDRVVVVTGHAGAGVEAAVSGYEVTVRHNPDFALGQSTSLHTGLDAAGVADAIVVVLADQPGIDPAAIDRVIDARQHDRAMIVITAYGSERGHPVLFGAEVFDELREVSGDEGGRSVIRRHPGDVILVQGEHDAPPLDVDTEDAWERLRDAWAKPSFHLRHPS